MAINTKTLKTSLSPVIRLVLVNVLKLSGWHLYLALKVIDAIWANFIAPFIQKEVRHHQMKKRDLKKEKLYNEIKSTTTKHNFKEQFNKMWNVSRGKQ